MNLLLLRRPHEFERRWANYIYTYEIEFTLILPPTLLSYTYSQSRIRAFQRWSAKSLACAMECARQETDASEYSEAKRRGELQR